MELVLDLSGVKSSCRKSHIIRQSVEYTHCSRINCVSEYLYMSLNSTVCDEVWIYLDMNSKFIHLHSRTIPPPNWGFIFELTTKPCLGKGECEQEVRR